MEPSYTFTEVNLAAIDVPAPVDEAKVAKLIADMKAGQLTPIQRAAVCCWVKPNGRLEVLDEPEKIVASIRLGYRTGMAYVVRCPPEMKRLLAVKMQLHVKRLEPISDSSHRHSGKKR